MRPDITLFQDLHRELAAAIRGWGASAEAAPVLATIVMFVGITVAVLLLLAILRAGFKGRIREIRQKCEALKAKRKDEPSAVRSGEAHNVVRPSLPAKPRQTKSSRVEGQLELLADLCDRGKISQEEYSRQRSRILEDV
jgi:uncharacterized membrane protein